MEGGMVVMGLLRASLNESVPRTTDFDQIFGRKYRSPVTKGYGGGEPPRRAAVGRLPWFVRTMLTHGGELNY
jgi:hypothetical protein